MMFESFFALPLLLTGAIIIGSLSVYGVVGLILVRRYILPRLQIEDADSDFCGAMQQAVMVFYGLAAALIVVNVWQNYSDVAKSASQEATSAAALYRDVSDYPEPSRGELQKKLRDYVDQIIHEAWPMMQRGETPTAVVDMMNSFQATLATFEPTTEGQKILHAE